MTVSLLLPSIVDAISHITVSGVTVRDVDELAASWVSLPNVLYPNDENFIENFTIQYDSLLEGTDAPMTMSYVLNYRFLGTLVGDAASMPVGYSTLVTKITTIINALVAVPSPYSGKVNMKIGSVSLGPRTDPSGNQYFGADLPLLIEELQN